MKKEKWLLKEIDNWCENEIVNQETANRLKVMYEPKKNINLMLVLFSIIGSALIGMGIVMLSANNWWYALPIAIRAFIGFLPLVISQAVVFFVYKCKMESQAFRESAALLNMAGVFSSIAIVGQIFHIPGDFTNYLLICGILFLPSMLVMEAISPLIVYYWTTINGALFFANNPAIDATLSIVLFAIGGVYALRKCRDKGGRSTYLSFATAISALALILVFMLKYAGGDMSFILFGYVLLLLSASKQLPSCGEVFAGIGKICYIILMLVLSYRESWYYGSGFDSNVFLTFTILVISSGLGMFIINTIKKDNCVFSAAVIVSLLVRGIWFVLDLSNEAAGLVFMIIYNVILFAISVMFIFDGIRKFDMYSANIGMITLCVLIVQRFFDSGLQLFVRGIVFLAVGVGFLLFNLYLVKTKKRIKEDAV